MAAEEEIELDAIESNRDEAPDYRPHLKSELGAPVQVETRMRYLAALESEERSRYEEFARVADDEGLSKIARVFRDIMKEEEAHGASIEQARSTLMNLKASIAREEATIGTIEGIIKALDRVKDAETLKKMRAMLADEEGHARRLRAALAGLEKEMEAMKGQRPSAAAKGKWCTFGVCVEEEEEVPMSPDI